MHSTGENVQWTPVAATYTAVTRATCSARPRSQVPAMPNWGALLTRNGSRGCVRNRTKSSQVAISVADSLRRQRFHRRLRHARQGRGRPDRVRRRAPAALAQTVVEQHEEGHYGERRYLSETSMRKLIDLKKARGSAALLVPQP